MTKLHKLIARAALATAVVGGTLAATSAPVAARVVCDRFHCWHVHRHYYDPYYYPSYYSPGVTFGFNFGGGRHWHGGHGGWHGQH